MSLPCIPCAEPQVCVEGLDRYSLQDDTFLPVLRCPPGQFCGRNNFLFILCCDGNQLRVDFTVGMSQTSRDRLIANAVAECERRRAFCEPGPPEPPEYFYSAPASCTVYCPDGTPFTYTVQAGQFLAKTLAEAQAAANAYACEQAPLQLFCIGSLVSCTCAGVPFSAVMASSPSKSLRFVVLTGALPPGITIPTGVVTNGALRLVGTPIVPGNYTFTIRAIDSDNNYIDKPYLLSVIGITTATLPGFTIGTPYSTQLAAAGGSGNYSFGISSGTLPDGLGMSSSGLISGTPTNSAVNSAITFEVVDTFCEEANPRIFVPRASLSTVAVTRIATVIGYDDFGGPIPPKRYKRVDYSGASFQAILDSATDTVRYSEHDEFVGFSQIDIHGNVLFSHQRNVQGRMGDLAQPWYSRGDKAVNSSGDISGFLGELTLFSSSPDSLHKDVTSPPGHSDSVPPPPIVDPVYPAGSPLIGTIPIATLEEIATQFSFPPEAFAIYPAIPRVLINNVIAPWINFVNRSDYHVVLSDEYTDSDALSVAQTLINRSNIARNEPRTFGYTSRYTTVTYSVTLTNLVVGQVYNVVVPFHLSNGSNQQAVHTFIAATTSHSINGIAPAPPPYITLEVRSPRIVFV